MRLRAARIWVKQDHNFANVAFADSAEDPEGYVVVTRTLAPTDIYRRLGIDGIYLEIDDQDSAAYRAATGYALKGQVLRIKIAPASYERLGITDDIVIQLDDPDLKKKTLRTALAAIFATEPT